MAKDSDPKPSSQEELSPAAKGMIDDATGLVGRLGTYLNNIRASNPSSKDEQLLTHSAALSVLEGLGAQIIRENLPDSEVYGLVAAINENTKVSTDLTNDPKEKEKMELQAARTEAALKGFVLPLSFGGNFDDMRKKGGLNLKDQEYSVAMEATKQAMKELWGKDIPKEKYSETLMAKTAEILENGKEKFPPEKLAQLNDFISKGAQVQKPAKVNDKELGLIKEAASKTVNHFVSSFNQKTTEAHVDQILEKSMQQMQSKGHKFNDATKKLLNENLKEDLSKLGPDYLKNHKEELATELSQSLKTNRSWKSAIFAGYEISEKNLKEKVAQGLSQKHLPLSQAEAAAAKLKEPTPVKKPILETRSPAPAKTQPTPETRSPAPSVSKKPTKPKPPPLSRAESEKQIKATQSKKAAPTPAESTKRSMVDRIKEAATKKSKTNTPSR